MAIKFRDNIIAPPVAAPLIRHLPKVERPKRRFRKWIFLAPAVIAAFVLFMMFASARQERRRIAAENAESTIRMAEVSTRYSSDPADYLLWEYLKEKARAAPPRKWYGHGDVDELVSSFRDWETFVVPEVSRAVIAWLESDRRLINNIIVNEPTGATYLVVGKKRRNSASCSVEFITNLNWE